MTDTHDPPGPISPPDRHQLALMIWLCVFPTLTALNVMLGGQLASMSPVVRTFVLATIAVPIVIYGLMPYLHRARARLLSGGVRGFEMNPDDRGRVGSNGSAPTPSSRARPSRRRRDRADVDVRRGRRRRHQAR